MKSLIVYLQRQKMLNENITKRIGRVKTQKEYEDLLETFKASTASIEIIEEAIKELKKQKPQFDEDVQYKNEKILKEIKESAADISDIGNY